MVSGVSLDVDDLAAASLLFLHPAGKDDYTAEVRSVLITKEGKRFEHTLTVDW